MKTEKVSRNVILLSSSTIATKIFFLRGHKILFDFELAQLYEIETRSLKQQVRRNIQRFPEDFMFELSTDEWKEVITNSDNLSKSIKFSPRPPMAFTEQGVAMLSSVLNSKKAILVNIEIMRAFVQLRKLIDSNKELAYKIKQLESKYDKQFKIIFETIRKLIEPEKPAKKPIGFRV